MTQNPHSHVNLEGKVSRTLFAVRKDIVISPDSQEVRGRAPLVEVLFKEHAPALRLFLRGRSVPQDEIEDLVQELYARLMDMDGLEEKMSAPTGSNRSFLLTMANNMIVDKQRKRQVREAYAYSQRKLGDGHLDERTPERIFSAQMELEAVKATIMNMRLNWRVALLLQRYRHMSYEEIASHMGVTNTQAENYVKRALRRIRKERRKRQARGGAAC